MMSADVAYHLLKLQIASNPADTQPVMPAIERLGYEDIEVSRRGFFVVTARKPGP